MPAIMRALVVLFLVFSTLHGATRSDVNAIEAAEKIRFLSQKITKNYLYLYSRPQRTELKKDLKKMIETLGKNFTVIASSTKDSSTKDLLKYLNYNQKNMEELLEEEVTKHGALKMLDYSEIFLEGADSITKEHSYPFNKEETMLMNIKKYEYLIERLGKFYMASSLGVLSQANRTKMNETAKALEAGIKKIQAYPYPKDLQKQKKDLRLFLGTGRYILSHTYDMFVPNILETASSYLEHLLSGYALYHSKSQ